MGVCLQLGNLASDETAMEKDDITTMVGRETRIDLKAAAIGDPS